MNILDFKKEFQELLAKYNVGIVWTCDKGSELSFVYNPRLEVVDLSTIHEKTVLAFDNDYIDKNCNQLQG